MSKKLLIIVGIPLVIVILVTAYLFFGMKKGGTSGPAQTPATTGQSAGALVPQVFSAMPVDAPQSDTFIIQTAGGGVPVKNFYKTAKGYAANTDQVLIDETSAYSLWYYRSSTGFEIALSGSATDADIASAEKALLADLGVNLRTLCGLVVAVTYPVDQGTDKQTLPLPGCATGAFSPGN